MDQRSDEVLIKESMEGELGAFKVLVQRHEGKVAGVVHSMLGQGADAEDVGQEVFIRFYESLGKFRGDSLVSTYLVRIAINLSLNVLKKRKRSFFRFGRIEEGMNVQMQNDTSDLKELLATEMTRLDSDFRSVVTLRLIEGYTTEETASILNIPLGTVLSRLARGQKKLQAALSKKLKP